MDFVLISVGSDGDVFPMISLGSGLALRGHRVTLLALPAYSGVAARNGIGFIPLLDDDSCASSLQQKWLLTTRYAYLYFERHSVSWNTVAYRSICNLSSKDLVVIAVDRPNLWADLFARARLGVPVIRVLVDLPFAGNVTGEVRLLPLDGLQQRLQRRVEAAWRESMAAIGVDTGRLRIERLWRSVRPVVPTVALWPSWVLGEGAAGCVIPAFGFLAAPRASEPPEDLPFDADPSRGLVVFVAGTLGTTRWWANRFFETSAEICRHLECAGVFLGGDATPEPQPGWISDLAIRRDFLPLRDVLPHASAIVHHGGMGTAAAAIECGVPQVVVPRVFAQPHNAEWLRRLGLCLVLDSHAYTASQGSAAVREVVGNPRYRSTAQSYAPRCDSEGGLRSACEYLESPSVMGGIRSAALRPHERRTGSKGPAWAKRSGLDG